MEKQFLVNDLKIGEAWRLFKIMGEFVEGIDTLCGQSGRCNGTSLAAIIVVGAAGRSGRRYDPRLLVENENCIELDRDLGHRGRAWADWSFAS